LAVVATAQFDSDVTIGGSLTVLGDIVLGENSTQALSVYAVTTFESTASPITTNAAFIANAGVTTNAAFTANGPITATAAVTVEGALTAQGNTVIGSASGASDTLTVNAVTTFAASSSPITANAPIIASAAVTVSGSLQARGNTVIGSASGASDTLTVNAVTTFAASSSPITANAAVVATAGMTVAGAFAASGDSLILLLLLYIPLQFSLRICHNYSICNTCLNALILARSITTLLGMYTLCPFVSSLDALY